MSKLNEKLLELEEAYKVGRMEAYEELRKQFVIGLVMRIQEKFKKLRRAIESSK
jgi:hypothetical protein